MGKTNIGNQGEQIAQTVYIKRGYRIIASNYFNRNGKRVGEIDFIALKEKQIRFVEVKARTSFKFGLGEEAVNRSKKIKISKAIKYFLFNHPEFVSYNPHVDIVILTLNPFDKTPQKIRIYSDVIVDYY